MECHVQKVNGIDLYYECWKNKNAKHTIVFIHGFLASSFSFRKLIPELKKDFNLISIDMPPFGKSGASNNFQYSSKNIAYTLNLLIDHLKFRNIHVVGHSLGGQIALNMMHQQPDYFNKAILLCSSGYIPKAKKRLILLSYIPFFSRFVKYHLGRTGVIGNLHQVVYDANLIDQKMIDGYEEPFHHPSIFKGLTKMIRDREDDLSSAELQTIKTPCLLLWGEHDKIVPLHIGKRLTRDLPNARLEILPKAGHLIPEEKVLEVSTAIKDFIL